MINSRSHCNWIESIRALFFRDSNLGSFTSWQTAILLMTALMLLFLRCPDACLQPQLWIEDGKIFFLTAHTEGIRSIFHPYAGYIHLLTRSCAWISTCLPYELIPIMFFAASLIGLSCTVLFISRATWLPKAHRVLFALAIVVVPANRIGEVFYNLTNMHWVLSIILILMLMTPVKNLESSRHPFAMLLSFFAIAINDPTICILLPFFLLRFIFTHRSNRLEQWLFVAATGAFAIQTSLIVTAPPNFEVFIPDFTTIYSPWLRLFYAFVTPIPCFLLGYPTSLAISSGRVLPALLMLPISLIAVILLIISARKSSRAYAESMAWFAIAATLWLISCFRVKYAPPMVPYNPDRYCYVPYVLLLFSLIRFPYFPRLSILNKATLIFIVCLIGFSISTSFRLVPKSSTPYPWRAAMSEYRKKGKVTINIIPGFKPTEFTLSKVE